LLRESFEEAVLRGALEEIGATGKVGDFLGSLEYEFRLANGTDINKTNIYFQLNVETIGEREPEEEELTDEVLWVDLEEAKRLIANVSHSEIRNLEYKILDRVKK
jgi:ADP-ribose pyrophosphatase YjhB (NUDIX family)